MFTFQLDKEEIERMENQEFMALHHISKVRVYCMFVEKKSAARQAGNIITPAKRMDEWRGRQQVSE